MTPESSDPPNEKPAAPKPQERDHSGPYAVWPPPGSTVFVLPQGSNPTAPAPPTPAATPPPEQKLWQRWTGEILIGFSVLVLGTVWSTHSSMGTLQANTAHNTEDIKALIEQGKQMTTSINTLSMHQARSDERLNSIDTRLNGIDTRLDKLEIKLDELLERVPRKGR